MSILKRLFGGGKKPPEWATFMEGDEFKAFGEALTKELEFLPPERFVNQCLNLLEPPPDRD